MIYVVIGSYPMMNLVILLLKMIIHMGYDFIKTVDGYIVGFNKICIEKGNEFNILRWQNFNNEFRKLHEQKIR